MAYARLRALLVEGADDTKAAKELKLTWEELQELKRGFYDHEAEILRGRSTEHTYIRFAIEQRQCIEDLDRVIADYQQQKNVTGYVSAVRAKSDILERVLKMGQELGLVERLSKGEGYAAGEAIKQMNNVQFRQYIINFVSDFHDLMLRFGDHSITQVTLGSLHQPLRKPKQPVKGHSRAAVHKGRRLVKDS